MSKFNRNTIVKTVINTLSRELKLEFKGKDPQENQQLYEALKRLIESNDVVKGYIDALYACINRDSLSREQKDYLLTHLELIPRYQELKTNLFQILSKNQAWLTDNDFVINLDLDAELFVADTQTFIDELYAPIDKRLQIDSRPIRRMDSLARLFSVAPGISVCSAAAIHDDRVIIAANLSESEQRESLISIIQKRCKALHEFIAGIDTFAEHEYDSAAENLYSKLTEHGAIALPKAVVIQAIKKFVHSICFDNDTFDTSIKAVFLAPDLKLEILVPDLGSDNTLMVECTTYDEKKVMNLGCGKAAKVGLVHAEQLIAWRIFNKAHVDPLSAVYNEENPLRIGVSKLCCKTCETNLQQLPIQTRGGHQQSYAGVVNLFNQGADCDPPKPANKAPVSPPRLAVTAQLNSPPDSAKKAVSYKPMLLGASARRQLFFDTCDDSTDSQNAAPLSGLKS